MSDWEKYRAVYDWLMIEASKEAAFMFKPTPEIARAKLGMRDAYFN